MKGQALTSLIIIMFIGLAIVTAAVTLVDLNSSITGKFESSISALAVAESGTEDALIRLLRNPSFSTETLSYDDGTAYVTVTPGNPLTIISRGVSGRHQRTIRVQIRFNSGVMVVDSWKEI